MALRTASAQPSTMRTSFVAQPAQSSSSANPSQAPNVSSSMPPELEQKLALLSSHRSVLGYMLIARGHHPSIIRHSGVVFEGEHGKKYASVVAKIVESVQSGLDEVRREDSVGAASPGDNDSDEVRFMRIRTKRHELLISPDERYLLAVLHDPGS